MPPDRLSDEPIKLRHDDLEEDYFSEEELDERPADVSDAEDTAQSDSNDGSEGAASVQDSKLQDEEDDSSQASIEDNENLKDISFGALAKAQASFAPLSKSRKRKLVSTEDSAVQQQTHATPRDDFHSIRESASKKPKQDLAARSSKHAPTVLSSRNPVSRRRTIVSPPPVTKFRDPRFDPAITSRTLNENSIARADKAYSFLTDYQASEILALKSEIKKSQKLDPDHAAELKKKLMSMESRLRNAETKSKEREILAKHKAQEKQAIQEGKKAKPYFLKKSDLKKEIERERVEGMGKRQKDKMEQRKRMREKTKEAKDMPWARRMG